MANLYSFNAQTETPQMLAERRARALAVAGSLGGSPTLGGGIGDLIAGLGTGLSRYRSDRLEREGNASGRTAVDDLMDILSRPPSQPLSTPGDDAVRSSLKAGLATGQVPQLATYTPGGPQNAGMPDTRPRPPQPPQAPPPVAEAPVSEGQMPAAPMAGVQPAGMQPASGEAALLPKLLAVLRNPWVTAGDKALVQKRYDDIIQKMDPEYQYDRETKHTTNDLAIAKAKIELKKLEHPDIEWAEWTNPKTGEMWIYDKKNPQGTKEKVIGAGAGAAGADPDVDEALKISKSYEGQAGFAGASQVSPLMRDMIKSIGNPSAMADLTFVNGLAKILDPTSVVREAEGKMVIESQGMAPQLLGYLNKAINGEQGLTPGVRADLVKVAMGRAKEWRDQAVKERKHFAGVMDATGHNPDVFLQQAPTFPHYGDTQNMQPPGRAPAPTPVPAVETWAIDPVTGKPKRVQ